MSIKKITTLALFLAAISSFSFAKEITIAAVIPAKAPLLRIDGRFAGALVKCLNFKKRRYYQGCFT